MNIDRRWIYAATGIILYALAGFLLAPWLVERTLVGTLEERLRVDTTVENLALNPFTLTLTVDGFSIAERDGSPVFGFQRLFVNFELVSLIRLAFSFDELHLIRPVVHFERLGERETNFSRLGEVWAATAPPDAGEPEAPSENTEPGSLVRLVVADLRIVDGHIAVTDRHREETFSTDFAPIDLAITDLSTLPEDSGTQQVTIRTESGAEVGWTGSLSVNPLAVSGDVHIHGTHTPLVFRYFQDELSLPIGLDGGEIDASLDYVVALDDAGELSIRVENLSSTVSGLVVSQPDHPELLEVDAFTVSGGSFDWPEQKVHIDDIHLDQVRIDAYRSAEGTYLPMPPVAEGESAAASTSAGAASPVELPPAAAVSATDDETAAADDAPRAAGETGSGNAAGAWTLTVDTLRLTGWSLNHTDTALEDGTVGISELNLTLSGISNAPGREMDLALDLTPSLGGRMALNGKLTVFPEITFTSEVSAEAVPLAIGQPYLDSLVNVGIQAGDLALAGTLSSTPDEPVLYEGEFRITGLELTDRVQDERLLAWQVLAVDRMKARPTELRVSSLALEAPYARVEIEQDGTSNLDRLVVADAETPAGNTDPAAEPGADSEAGPTGAPFVLTIGETRVADGSAHFEDRNLPLPFEANITDIDGTLSTLASNSNAAARVGLEGQVNEYGRLKIAGSLQPFAPVRGTDVEVAFGNVDLPRMSPYTIKFAGREIADGRVDLTLTYQVVDQQLEGDNHLVIRDLRLGEKVPHPDAMNLPLDLAVALLKDPSGVVDFSFPVSGSLEDPEFSYAGAVRKAFSNVILGIATAPFRLLGSLVGVSPSEFEYIAFEPGRSDLTPPQRETLAKLADALTQRPQLTLALTPVFDPETDRHALKEARLEAELEARLAAEEETDALISERRLEHLETLYDERGLTPDRAELRDRASPANEEGETTFDALAYAELLRESLIDAAVVPEGALDALAGARAEAVRQSLTAAVNLAPERLTALDVEVEEADEDGQIRMPLKVTAGGASAGAGS